MLMMSHSAQGQGDSLAMLMYVHLPPSSSGINWLNVASNLKQVYMARRKHHCLYKTPFLCTWWVINRHSFWLPYQCPQNMVANKGCQESNFSLHKRSFGDAVALRYGWLPSSFPTKCSWGSVEFLWPADQHILLPNKWFPYSMTQQSDV